MIIGECPDYYVVVLQALSVHLEMTALVLNTVGGII
jgi:hypothetical protein